jgi:hypothetical protein
MKQSLALFFSIVGVGLLAGISYSISIGSPWLALAFAAASTLFIGFGFIVKARQRRGR